MRNFLLVFIIILFLFPTISSAVTVKLKDGTELSLDNLTNEEQSRMIRYIKKINENSTNSNVQSLINADPVRVDQWRKVISGTIKDVANDLGVTVNEFVKTPVGLGVAFLIFYKVMGKDMLSTLFDVVFIIPFWITVMIVIALTCRYYLGYTTEYIKVYTPPRLITDDKIREGLGDMIEKDEKIKIKIPVRKERYVWNSTDAKTTLGCFMVGIPIFMTFFCLGIVFL